MASIPLLALVAVALPKIRAPCRREALGLAQPPAGNARVVTAGEHLGNASAFPLARPRVLGIFEQTCSEAFFGQRQGLTHDPGQQPHNGVDQHHGRQFAAGKDVVTDRNLVEPARLNHALIDALEPAGQQQHARPVREALRRLLRQALPAWPQTNTLPHPGPNRPPSGCPRRRHRRAAPCGPRRRRPYHPPFGAGRGRSGEDRRFLRSSARSATLRRTARRRADPERVRGTGSAPWPAREWARRLGFAWTRGGLGLAWGPQLATFIPWRPSPPQGHGGAPALHPLAGAAAGVAPGVGLSQLGGPKARRARASSISATKPSTARRGSGAPVTGRPTTR